ncbi:MAG: DUF2510 domain-containing protein [Actinobacteria bacterium]|nr:DUF2510 domain-containing protein [Actinomycetota bacterium]
MSHQAFGSGQPRVAPGWYPDPGGNGHRWWDGIQWTEFARPQSPVSSPRGQATGSAAPIGATSGAPIAQATGAPNDAKSAGRPNRHPVLGLIGVLWGGGILYRSIYVVSPTGNDAYDSGVSMAAVLGAAMLGMGLRAIILHFREN